MSAIARLAALTVLEDPEFVPFPKIARWNRDVVVTEKLDGTNAAVLVLEDGRVFSQSRKRIIFPGQDNFGFAAWVGENQDELRDGLGPGLHFGEWWGQGIQRGYGLLEKRFSLFNTRRWSADAGDLFRCAEVPCCHVVPTLGTYDYPAEGLFGSALIDLREFGSHAARGFLRPEGIVIFHRGSGQLFKVTLDNDEKPKGQP